MITAGIVGSILSGMDIEGLLELGAPADEYESEAKKIASRAVSLRTPTADELLPLVSAVWRESFGPFSPDQESRRRGALAEAATRIAEAALKP